MHRFLLPCIFTLLCLFQLSTVGHAAIANLNQQPVHAHARPTNAAAAHKPQHDGFFKKLRNWRKAKASLKTLRTQDEQKASPMARTALSLYLGAIGLTVGIASVTTFSAIIGTIIIAAFVASILLSIVVLFSKANKRSRAIAKTILWTTASVLVFFVVFMAILLSRIDD